MMQALYQRSSSHPLWDYLPVYGQKGTLAHRHGASFLRGHVIAKTGSLRDVSTLVGRVDTRAHHPLYFAFLMQGASTKRLRIIQDHLLAIMYKEAV